MVAVTLLLDDPRNMLLANPILTDDLVLRSLDFTYANKTYRDWLSDPEVNRYLECRFAKHTVDSIVRYIQTMNASQSNLLLGIFLGSRHIGNIKLGPVDGQRDIFQHGTADLSIMIGDKSAWNSGYGTQAVEALTDHAFTEMRLARVEAGFYAPNVSSRRAFAKAGFFVEGVRRHRWILDGRRCDEILMARLRHADKSAPDEVV